MLSAYEARTRRAVQDALERLDTAFFFARRLDDPPGDEVLTDLRQAEKALKAALQVFTGPQR